MVDVRPFRALRPTPATAAAVLAPPYDVVDTSSARTLAGGRPESFLHVSRPEIDLPDGTPADSGAVHAQGRHALDALVARGALVRDEEPAVYAYRLTSGSHSQTGLVCVASVDDYGAGRIAVHEDTRADKELDRVHHLDAVGAHDEPVFLVAPPSVAFAGALGAATAGPPETTVTAPDGVRHEVWPVRGAAAAALVGALAAAPRAYVADGHHRSAAALRVRELRRSRGDRSPGLDAFLAVVFPTDVVRVLAYDRVVADLGTRAPEEVLAALRGAGFEVAAADGPFRPGTRHEMAARLGGRWYALTATRVDESNPVGRLDVALLQDRVLQPLLGVADPRTDPRMTFVGGNAGVTLLAAADGAAAFALHPTSVEEMVACADAGARMPPKSTWFDPKLGSGLFVHSFRD